MATVEIKTGEIEKWAQKMEEKGAEFAAEVVKKVKGGREHERRRGKIKFAKIKRQKSGAKRFAARQGAQPRAELISEKTSSKFSDIFKGNK